MTYELLVGVVCNLPHVVVGLHILELLIHG